jgi:hypothetical protein
MWHSRPQQFGTNTTLCDFLRLDETVALKSGPPARVNNRSTCRSTSFTVWATAASVGCG